jgi:biopolymer transport protein TolR
MGADLGNESKSEPNVVPLCDILLVLLIIFMVITPSAQQGIDIQLPEKADKSSQQKTLSSSRVITIEKDNSIKLNLQVVPLERLRTTLRDIYLTQSGRKRRIFIRADESVSYKEVLRVIDIVNGAGIEVLGVMTDRYKTPVATQE